MVELGFVVIVLTLAVLVFFGRELMTPGMEDVRPLQRQRSEADRTAAECAPPLMRPEAQKPHAEIVCAVSWQSVQVVGTSYANETGVCRQDCIGQLIPTDKLWLERDTANTHDRNALRVMSAHGQLGFIPRALAAQLATVDGGKLSVTLLSKGRASNGLWGCSVRLGVPAVQAPAALMPATPPPETGFKKASALQAAREGRLSYTQLLSVIDRARDLGLEPHEVEVFETARRHATPPPPPPPRKKEVHSCRFDDDDEYPHDDYPRDDGFDGIESYWHQYHKHD